MLIRSLFASSVSLIIGNYEIFVFDILGASLDAFGCRIPFRGGHRDIERDANFFPPDVQNGIEGRLAVGAFIFVAPFDSYFRHVWCANF